MTKKSQKARKPKMEVPPFHFNCKIQDLFFNVVKSGPTVISEILEILKAKKDVPYFNLCTVSDLEITNIAYFKIEEGKCCVSQHFFAILVGILKELKIFYFISEVEKRDPSQVTWSWLDLSILNELEILNCKMISQSEYEKVAHFRTLLWSESENVRKKIRAMNAHIFPGKE